MIVEDSNSGYEFYRALCEKIGIRCESADFFSWEQFFTKELVGLTADTYLAYRKKSLNTAYLQSKEMAALKKGVARSGTLVALVIDSFTWICLLASLSKITV